MNKKLISLLTGVSLLTGCSVNSENIFDRPEKEKLIEEKILISSEGVLQNSYLMYHDMFTYTKQIIEGGGMELNPVWAPLLNNNQHLFGLTYSIQVGTLILGNILSYKIDNSGNLANMLNGALSLAEILTIEGMDKQIPQKNLDFNVPLFTLRF